MVRWSPAVGITVCILGCSCRAPVQAGPGAATAAAAEPAGANPAHVPTDILTDHYLNVLERRGTGHCVSRIGKTHRQRAAFDLWAVDGFVELVGDQCRTEWNIA